MRGGYYTDAVTSADLLPLTDEVIEQHLRGNRGDRHERHIGLYPLLENDMCRFLVCDFDDGSWKQDAAAFVAACKHRGIDALAEISRSGDGAHVWIFFEDAVPATGARALGASLLRDAISRVPTMSLASYDRLFPSQDTLPLRSSGRLRLGNLIALPLQGQHRRNGTTIFADAHTWEPLSDQFAALSAITPVKIAQIEEHITRGVPITVGPEVSKPRRARREEIRAARAEISNRTINLVRDHMVHISTEGVPAVVLSELKHAASISNPEFYRKKAQRFSTFGTPRLIVCFEHDNTELRIPRGLLDKASEVLTEVGFTVETQVRDSIDAAIDVDFTGELRPEQRAAVDSVASFDTGVLVAPRAQARRSSPAHSSQSARCRRQFSLIAQNCFSSGGRS